METSLPKPGPASDLLLEPRSGCLTALLGRAASTGPWTGAEADGRAGVSGDDGASCESSMGVRHHVSVQASSNSLRSGGWIAGPARAEGGGRGGWARASLWAPRWPRGEFAPAGWPVRGKSLSGQALGGREERGWLRHGGHAEMALCRPSSLESGFFFSLSRPPEGRCRVAAVSPRKIVPPSGAAQPLSPRPPCPPKLLT